MNETRKPCWFCDDGVRTDQPAGGWLYDDGTWRIGHVPGEYAVAGTLILEARRHVADQSAMNDAELGTLASTAGRAIRAMTEVLGCDRVYQWSTMDAYPHYHLWLVPWWETAQRRGPAYLQWAVTDGACSAADAEATAGALHEALGRTGAGS